MSMRDYAVDDYGLVLDEETVQINDIELNVEKDTYDFRND